MTTLGVPHYVCSLPLVFFFTPHGRPALYGSDHTRLNSCVRCFAMPFSHLHSSSPAYAKTGDTPARRMANFVREGVQVLRRRRHLKAEQLWLRSELYPEYYRSTFHFQTDGWMSSWSADVYETATETLFVGGQDAMQRTALVPLSK